MTTQNQSNKATPAQVSPPALPATTKAAPPLPEGWTDCTIEFGNDGPEVVAYGPKRMMNRLAKWLGKYFAQVIADAAPKAAPGDALDEVMRERDEAEDFIDALLDEVLGHERPEWSSSYGRADALNDVQERITALHKPAVDKAWGQFQSAMAAPQQEAQEPVATLHCDDIGYVWAWVTEVGTRMRFEQPINLYTAPQPAPAPMSRDQIREVFMAHGFTIKEGQTDLKQYVYDAAYALLGTKPAPLSGDVMKDAARYRWLIDQHWIQTEVEWRLISTDQDSTIKQLDAAIDAALAAQGGE